MPQEPGVGWSAAPPTFLEEGRCPSNLDMIQKLFPIFFIFIFAFLRFPNEVTEIRGGKMRVGGFWPLPWASAPPT